MPSLTVVLLLWLVVLALLLWILVVPLWLWERSSSRQQQRLELLEAAERELRQAIASLETRLAHQAGSRAVQPSDNRSPAAAAEATTPSTASS